MYVLVLHKIMSCFTIQLQIAVDCNRFPHSMTSILKPAKFKDP